MALPYHNDRSLPSLVPAPSRPPGGRATTKEKGRTRMSLVRQAALGGTLLALALTGLAVTPAGAAAPGGPATRRPGKPSSCTR